MVTNRITVSLDDDAQSALDGLAGRTDKAQSEVVREALVRYVMNDRDSLGSHANSTLQNIVRGLVTLLVVWLGLPLYTVAADMGVF